MKKITLFLAVSGLFLTGCENDNTKTVNPVEDVYGQWTEMSPTEGRHHVTFRRNNTMLMTDTAETGEVIQSEFNYALQNNELILTNEGSDVPTNHAFQQVDANTIMITDFGNYVNPDCAECPSVIVTLKRDTQE